MMTFDDSPKKMAPWEATDQETKTANFRENYPVLTKENPVLPMPNFKNGGLETPDLLTGEPLENLETRAAWEVGKKLFADRPKHVELPEKLPILVKEKEKGDHCFDHNRPDFDFSKYWNQFNKKYRCPWPSCK
jgi:hypothetical protein